MGGVWSEGVLSDGVFMYKVMLLDEREDHIIPVQTWFWMMHWFWVVIHKLLQKYDGISFAHAISWMKMCENHGFGEVL